MRTPIAAALALVLAFGCTDQTTSPTALNDAAVAPTFNFLNGPASAGIVLRYETPFAVSWADPESGLRATVGFDTDEYCANIIDFDIVAVQDVDLPTGRLLGPVQGDDMQTAVWPFTAFDCALFTTVEPLATGVSEFRLTDNDVFGTVVNNANAWGWRTHGALTLASGDKAQFSGHINRMFTNDGQFTITSKVSLH